MEMKTVAKLLISRDANNVSMIELFTVQKIDEVKTFWRFSGESHCYKVAGFLNINQCDLDIWCRSKDWKLLGVEFLS